MALSCVKAMVYGNSSLNKSQFANFMITQFFRLARTFRGHLLCYLKFHFAQRTRIRTTIVYAVGSDSNPTSWPIQKNLWALHSFRASSPISRTKTQPAKEMAQNKLYLWYFNWKQTNYLSPTILFSKTFNKKIWLQKMHVQCLHCT